MDLPIFNDNLKSSASWADLLAGEREAWDSARQAPDARAQIEARTRREQVEQALRRAGWGNDGRRLGGSPTLREGVDIDPCPPSRSGYRQSMLEATELVSGWAADPEAKFGVERLLDLHRTVVGAPAGMDVLRKTEPTPINATHEPTPALLLPRMLDNAFDWFDTESFRDLRPVEYADRYRIYFAPGAYRVDTIEGLSLIAHEVAHCLQYQRHGAWRFRARYLAAYFKNRLRGMNHLRAYRSIPFEVEARVAEEQVYRALKTLQSGLLETL